jgi:hypothetical protein
LVEGTKTGSDFDKLRANGRNVYFQSNDIGPNPSVNSAPSAVNDFLREGGELFGSGVRLYYLWEIFDWR